MDRRNFLRMSATNSAKVAAGSLAFGAATSESIIEKYFSSVAEDLNALKEKFAMHSEQIKQSSDLLEQEIARAADEIFRNVDKKFASLENRISTNEIHHIVMVIWLTALTLVTGLDFISGNLALFSSIV